MTDVDPAHAPPSWTTERLWSAIRALGARFACAVDGLDEAALTAELATLVQTDTAGAALLACAFACLSRTQAWGPALAVGPWSGSLLVSVCGGGLDRFADLDDLTHGARFAELRQLQEEFLSLLARGEAGMPRFLLCSVPTERLADDLMALLADYPVAAAPADDTQFKIQYVQDDLSTLHIIIGPGEPPMSGATVAGHLASLHGAASMTWRVFCLATSDVEQHTGQRIGWLVDQDQDALLAALPPHPTLRWLDDVPPPAWQALSQGASHLPSSGSHGEGSQELAMEAAQPPSILPTALDAMPAPARSVLRTRQDLLWQLGRLAALHPASVWAAVLQAAPTGARAEIAVAARAADAPIPLPEPDVVSSPDAPEPFARSLRLDGQPVEIFVPGSLADGTPVRVAPGWPAPQGDHPWQDPSPYIAIEHDGTLLWVAGELVDDAVPGVLRVDFTLSGIEDADLALIDAVCEVLQRFPGPHEAVLTLHYAGRRRSLPPLSGVAWSTALQTALATLVGDQPISFSRGDGA